jgi:hypothetical protein
MRLIWSALVLVACATNAETAPALQAAPLPARSSPPPSAAAGPTSERPPGTDALEELLRAFHPEDLPSKDALAHHPGAHDSLVWLASNGEPLSMRARALTLLAHHPSPTSSDLLVDVASNPGSHPSLRAAALLGLGGHDLAGDASLRALVEAGLTDPDPRVRHAAERALTTP